jgi:amino acid transporter
MTAPDASARPHPAPHAGRVSSGESIFGLFAGPLAWFVQLCCGYVLASEPCFQEGSRTAAPPPALHWTWPAMVVLTLVAVVVSLAAFGVSMRAFNRTRHETEGGAHYVLEVGAGRTRFLALWGMVLGAGFAVAAAITAVAFIAVPRCAG